MTEAELAQALIKLNGGCSPIAASLGCRVQRVFNWTTRGIPARVQLQRPDLFGPHRVMEAMRNHEPRETPAVITGGSKPKKERAAAEGLGNDKPDRSERGPERRVMDCPMVPLARGTDLRVGAPRRASEKAQG